MSMLLLPILLLLLALPARASDRWRSPDSLLAPGTGGQSTPRTGLESPATSSLHLAPYRNVPRHLRHGSDHDERGPGEQLPTGQTSPESRSAALCLRSCAAESHGATPRAALSRAAAAGGAARRPQVDGAGGEVEAWAWGGEANPEIEMLGSGRRLQQAAAAGVVKSTLLVAVLNGQNVVPVAGPFYGKGLAFLLLDPQDATIKFFLADLSGIGTPRLAVIGEADKGAAGEVVATFHAYDTFVGVTELGYAFAGTLAVSSHLLDALLAEATGFYISVTTDGFPDGALRGQLLDPGTTTTALPSLLFPAQLLGTGGLGPSLVSVRVKARAEATIVTRGGATAAASFPYLNLTLEVEAMGAALPAAIQALVAAAASDPSASPLTSFVAALLPALPALARRLPSVGTGQLVQAGIAALLATVIGCVGYAPSLDGPSVLAALSSALDAALVIAPSGHL